VFRSEIPLCFNVCINININIVSNLFSPIMASNIKLYYWPINFRGHLIRALLRYANVAYEDAPVSELVALKNAPISADKPAIFMAPPLLQDGANYYSQTPAIIAHLGRKTGMCPSDPHKLTICDVVVGNCNDIVNDLTRQCGMKRWDPFDLSEFEEFINGRFVKWCTIIEALARQSGLQANSKFFCGGDSATYADTTVFACFAVMARCLPLLEPVLRSNMPFVMSLIDRLSTNDGLKALMDESDPAKYCGGYIEASLRATLSASSLSKKTHN
jgi:glutathione S-transferase